MPTYKFEARDPLGEKFNNSVEADSEQEALELIKSAGYLFIKINSHTAGMPEIGKWEASRTTANAADLKFRFKWQDEKGEDSGKKLLGHFDGSELTLDDAVIPADAILEIYIRKNVLSMSVQMESEQTFSPSFKVLVGDAEQLMRQINTSRSDIVAAKAKAQLVASGRDVQFHSAICPFCAATMVLTDCPHTPQVYCEYCETIFTTTDFDKQNFDVEGKPLTAEAESAMLEKDFRLCDQCGMYSRPEKFLVFYFYFLFVVYGFYHNTSERCRACMRSDAWKMAFGNLFGLIGLPVAFYQLVRAYRGNKTGPFAGLNDANHKAHKGKIDKALDLYDGLMDEHPVHAGIKFNIALGLMQKEQYDHAEQMLRMSLEDCGNYWPSFRSLILVLNLQDKTKEANSLMLAYGLEDDEDFEQLPGAGEHCPACGFGLNPTETYMECPDCGISFGDPT